MTGPRLGPDDLAAVERIMAPADEALARGYPGDPGTRQPVHTVYVPADRVLPGIAQRYGAAALASLEEHAPDPGTFADVVGADPERVAEVWPLLLAKPRASRSRPARHLENGYRGHFDDEETGTPWRPSRRSPVTGRRRTGGFGSRASRPPPGPVACARWTWCWAPPSTPDRCPTASG